MTIVEMHDLIQRAAQTYVNRWRAGASPGALERSGDYWSSMSDKFRSEQQACMAEAFRAIEKAGWEIRRAQPAAMDPK